MIVAVMGLDLLLCSGVIQVHLMCKFNSTNKINPYTSVFLNILYLTSQPSKGPSLIQRALSQGNPRDGVPTAVTSHSDVRSGQAETAPPPQKNCAIAGGGSGGAC